MDEGIQTTVTVHEIILSTAEPFEGTTKHTQVRSDEGKKPNSDGNTACLFLHSH
ncbi:hypothetical protein DPMN_044448 [Dreissena polymorpha]|uniref:Uncharacterized protein n=1 Tax=Dreissena polymorpha TaxID=45954 RepID=A0A9D4D389_DREPO|nr:hypothetical protein DPMN_044448 [Dreissena polymorpha]